ncbi:MAG: TolC family protein, partial [Burkholderiales bacterium]|nr:TolC family protein [Burkholderiales bacterium]
MSGCSIGPEYVRPNAELPDAWKVAPAAGKAVVTERWWTVYGDPMLDRLIDEALVNNQDLALATARLDEARALARVADSRLAPAIDGQLQRDRSHRSDSTATRIPGSLENNNYRAQLNVSYELDLWGRLRSTAKAAQAELLANAAA